MVRRRWGLCLSVGLFCLAARCFNLVGTKHEVLRIGAGSRSGRRPRVERRIQTYDAFEYMGNPFDARHPNGAL